MIGKVAALVYVAVVVAIKEEDLMHLPHVTFEYNFKQYSGYLRGSEDGKFKMFYWLIESQDKPGTDPLLLWFNGGPGCSSLSGAFTELGPFYVNKGGETLFQNPYAFNRHANVLFLETPVGVGFSYNTDNVKNFTTGDDLTAEINARALADFFNRVQPQFKDRTFFISGESYAGIYIPTLTKTIIRQIKDKKFPNPNLQGLFIGNGYMNIEMLLNSHMIFNYYHGLIGVDDWEIIKQHCCPNLADIDKCDFWKEGIEFRNPEPVPKNNTCGKMIDEYLYLPFDQANNYNVYQDCYRDVKKAKRSMGVFFRSFKAFKNAADSNDYDSTDAQDGYPCFYDNASIAFLNREDVQEAFHVDKAWRDGGGMWSDCNIVLEEAYHVTYTDMTPVFEEIINNPPKSNFRIVIYNGDVDLVCNFLGDAWLFRDITKANGFQKTPRTKWLFRNQIAGFQQTYTKGDFTIDVLTVKGAGHMVPNDRPGPTLQMLMNFFQNSHNYNKTDGFDPKPIFAPTATGTTTAPSLLVLLSFAVIAYLLYMYS